MRTSKSDIIKYVFAVFVIILAVVTYFVYQKSTNKKTEVVKEKTEETYNIVKELRIGVAEFDSMNPLLSNNKNIQSISKLIFDSLITFDENYNFNYNLATEISKTNNTEYIIKLRDNVTWHTGESFSANDVKFTIETLKKLKSVYTENVKYVGSVEVIDNNTLKITLSRQVPFFEYNLTFPILSESYYRNENFSKTAKNATVAGTGMYRIDTTAKNLITLVKNTSYWNKEKKNVIIEKIDVKLYSNMGDLYNAFKNGNVDMVDTNLKSIKNYIGTLGYTAATYPTKEFDYLAFNCKSDALSDKAARKAINYAINKDTIIKSIYGDNYSTSTFPLDFGSWVYNTSSVKKVYSEDEAKRILQNNDWKYSGGVWRKNINGKNTTLEFTITVNNTNDVDIKLADNIKNQLNKIGIKVNIKEVSKNNYYNMIGKKSGYDAILVNINTSYSPSIETYMGSNNTSNYKNEEVTNLLNEIYATGDANKIKELYEKIITIYNEDVPFVGIARKNNAVVYNTNLVGTTKPTAFNIFNKFQNWYRKNY